MAKKKKKKASKKRKTVRKAKKRRVSKKRKTVRKAKKRRVSKKRKTVRKAKKRRVSKKRITVRKAKKLKSVKKRKKKKTNLKKQNTKNNNKIFKVQADWAKKAYIDKIGYEKKYSQSINDNDAFWAEEGKRIDWIKPYSKIKDVTYSKENVDIKWFYDGTLNVSYNCIDRHLPRKANDTAIIFEGDDPTVDEKITYQELKNEVCKLANGLKEIGVQKGDRVTIYMPMVPQAVYSMLACARIGAVHSVVFGGFSADSLAGRITDCKSEFVITADQGVRGAKVIPLKNTTDEALEKCPDVKKCVVLKHTGADINMNEGKDVWYHDITEHASEECEPEEMNAEDPLFILYTSGSTGKPKGAPFLSFGIIIPFFFAY